MSIQSVKKVLLWGFLLSMTGLLVYVFVSLSSGINMMVIFLIIALGIAAMIALGVVSIVANNQRKAALQLLAQERGLSYAQGMEDWSLLLGGNSFEITSIGHYRRMKNVLSGQWRGFRLGVFDMHYITGSGKNQSAHTQTCILLSTDELGIPYFIVKPEGVFNRLANALGQKEIDFDEDPDFSKQFQLISEDEAGARRLFTPIVREWFKAHRGISSESAASSVLFYRRDRVLEVADILQLLEEAAVLVSQLKRYSF